MRLGNSSVGFVLALCTALPAARGADAKFNDLLQLVPESANAIVLIDVAGVHKSPLALREKWKDTHEKAYVDRPLILPPEADRMVLSAQLYPQGNFQAAWELAAMDLSEEIPLKAIARAEGGYVDQLNSMQAVWTPSDAYFIRLAPNRLGVRHPADRQAASRWANFASANSRVVASPYLVHAAELVGGPTQIVLALDLQNVVQPHRIRERFEKNLPKALAGKKVDLAKLAEVISSISGIMLTVNVGEKMNGRMQVDFGQRVEILAPFAKPLLLEILSELGAKIDGLDAWKSSTGPYSVTLDGELSRDAMRRIFSLLELPTSKFSTLSKESQKEGGKEVVLTASKQYFDAVNVLIADLRKGVGAGAANLNVWMDRYAQKIDRLPVLHVDDDVLKYGSGVSDRFRQISLAKQSAGMAAGVRTVNSYSGYSYSDGAYVAGNVPQAERDRINTEENVRARSVRINLWQEIDEQTAATRKAMTKRYEIEF